MCEAIDPLKQLFDKTVREHEETYNPDVSRDFIDAYLKEIENTKDSSSSFHKDNIAGER